MLKAVLIGAGNHAEYVHGPSLARYAKEHPEELELAAVFTRREERARLFREQFGFARSYADVNQMLEAERPDWCFVCVPIEATREVAGAVMERGVPVLYEKPPGKNLQEARELAEISVRTGTPNAVAFNRRWAPCTQQALAWIAEHGPVEYVHARMLRFKRMDEEFAFGTGIHLLDCVRLLAEAGAGGIARARTVRTRAASGAFNFTVDLDFRSGARGRCDILPTCGSLDETYVLYGKEATVVASLPWAGGGKTTPGRAELWVEGKLVEAACLPADPLYLGSGFYQQVAAFVAARREGRRPTPSSEEAVASVALATAVQAGEDISF